MKPRDEQGADMAEGIPGPIEEVFGAFEPRFYGVSLVLESVAHYRAWASMSDDSIEKADLEISAFDWAFLSTTLEHENRHFHDSLLSPFSSSITFLRMLAAYNGLRLLNRISKLGGNCLPVPATEWMYKSTESRAAWIAEATSPEEAVKLRPVALPMLSHLARDTVLEGLASDSDDDANDQSELGRERLARATIGYYEGAAALMKGATEIFRPFKLALDDQAFEPDAIAAPRNYFEASALAVQLQAAWTNGDGSAFEPVSQFVNTSEFAPPRFFRRLSRATSLPGGRVSIDPHKISAAAIWCLLGDATSRSTVDPSIRCLKLLRLLDSYGIVDAVPTAELWDVWDTRLGMAPWRSNLASLKARTADWVKQICDAETAGGSATFSIVLRQYLEDQKCVIDLLLQDPDCYVSPYRYLYEATEKLPKPVTSIELGSNFIVPLDAVPDVPAVRFPRLYDRDGKRGWNRTVLDPTAAQRPGFLDAVIELEIACKISDVVFSNETLRPIENDAFRAAVQNTLGVVPMYVF